MDGWTDKHTHILSMARIMAGSLTTMPREAAPTTKQYASRTTTNADALCNFAAYTIAILCITYAPISFYAPFCAARGAVLYILAPYTLNETVFGAYMLSMSSNDN